MLSDTNRVVLFNRTKSFLWRAGMMLLALGVDFTLANLELLDLSPQTVVVLGLFLGEVSKWLNAR